MNFQAGTDLKRNRVEWRARMCVFTNAADSLLISLVYMPVFYLLLNESGPANLFIYHIKEKKE